MKRKYQDGEHNDVVYYIGTNVEKTLAYGMKTLFLTQIRPPKMVADIAEDRECTHVYIGPGGTFRPSTKEHWQQYDEIVEYLTEHDYMVSIEHNLTQSQWFLESGYAENNMVIPVLSVAVPFIAQYGNNACLKIYDKGFNETNPGVWVHSYNDITKTEAFTHWNEYRDDLPV